MKRSFVLYIDTLEALEDMTNEDAGILFKAMRDYHNGNTVEIPDHIKPVFRLFEMQFKRDGVKYEKKVERNRENGKKGGRPKEEPTETHKNPVGSDKTHKNPEKPDSGSGSGRDSESDNGNDNGKKGAFSFREELVKLGIDEQVADDFMEVRKKKKATNTKTAFNRLRNQLREAYRKYGKMPNEIISHCVFKDWKGFEAEWLQNEGEQSKVLPNDK